MTHPTVIKLHDGNLMPQLGLGVWKAGNEEVVSAIHKALEVGYRSFDTAAAYQNETGVGNALHHNPDPEHIPCYRVMNFRGELSGAFAFGGKDVQKKLLEADGIEVVNGTVDLKKYGLTQRDEKL